jgi:hypothetical protein
VVIEVAVHLPVTKIEPALRATTQTRAICPAAMRKRAAQFSVPATKHTRHETPDLSGYLPLPSYLSIVHRPDLRHTSFHVANAKTPAD